MVGVGASEHLRIASLEIPSSIADNFSAIMFKATCEECRKGRQLI
jgi:hypothetical protein